MENNMKEKFKIKNYIKLICMRVDHYESYIEDEVNTDCISDINDFVIKHRGEEGVKLLMIEMKDMRMTTINEVRKYIQDVHVFDYIRNLLNSGHKLVTADEVKEMSIGEIVEYLLDFKE